VIRHDESQVVQNINLATSASGGRQPAVFHP
jgi:hypothetical protein